MPLIDLRSEIERQGLLRGIAARRCRENRTLVAQAQVLIEASHGAVARARQEQARAAEILVIIRARLRRAT